MVLHKQFINQKNISIFKIESKTYFNKIKYSSNLCFKSFSLIHVLPNYHNVHTDKQDHISAK